jgi:sugar phosphate isomerase/epimerase
MLVLSSGWMSAREGRGAAVMVPLLELLHRLPFSGLALDERITRVELEEVRAPLARRELRVQVLRGAAGGPPPEPHGEAPARRAWLASQDASLRHKAVDAHLRTLELASDLEAPLLTVSLGPADPDSGIARVARAYTETEAAEIARLHRRGAWDRRRALDAARYSLDALLSRAVSLGVEVALENPALPLELPSPEELYALFEEFRGAPIAYAHDVGAARLCRDLAGPPGRELLEVGRDHLRALYLSDAAGREMGLVPGRGEIDFAGLFRAVAQPVARVLDPRADWSVRDVEEAVERLGSLG